MPDPSTYHARILRLRTERLRELSKELPDSCNRPFAELLS